MTAPQDLPQNDTPAPVPDDNVSQDPSLALSPEKASEIKGDNDCQPGDLYSATVQLKVKSVGDDGSITFDVPEISNFMPSTGDAETGSDPLSPEAESSGPPEMGLRPNRPNRPSIIKGVAKGLQN